MFIVLLIGVSLSMDAFAVSVTNGLTLENGNWRHGMLMGLYFGGFQWLMPLLGCFLGSTVSGYISALAPYVSFVLLAFVGGKMIVEARMGEGRQGMARLSHGRLLMLAVATSIDALAVGVSFAFSPPEPGVFLSCVLIGCTTFCLSLAGFLLGSRFAGQGSRRAEVIGGVILIAIGVRMLL